MRGSVGAWDRNRDPVVPWRQDRKGSQRHGILEPGPGLESTAQQRHAEPITRAIYGWDPLLWCVPLSFLGQQGVSISPIIGTTVSSILSLPRVCTWTLTTTLSITVSFAVLSAGSVFPVSGSPSLTFFF